MNLLLRVFFVRIAAFFRKHLKLLDSSVLTLWVLPNDLDIYFHMNNGRYLTVMDLGRFDLIVRSGLGEICKKNHLAPLVASVTVKYKRSLKLFQRYQLVSRIVCWDDKWVFIKQSFIHDGKCAATGYVKGLFRSPKGNVPTAQVLALMGMWHASPPMPEAVKHWMLSEEPGRVSHKTDEPLLQNRSK